MSLLSGAMVALAPHRAEVVTLLQTVATMGVVTGLHVGIVPVAAMTIVVAHLLVMMTTTVIANVAAIALLHAADLVVPLLSMMATRLLVDIPMTDMALPVAATTIPTSTVMNVLELARHPGVMEEAMRSAHATGDRLL